MTPIVFIHGLIGSLRELPHEIGLPGALTPDLLGYGEHRAFNPEKITLHAQVAYLESWICNHSSEPVHVVGHSVGGAVAVLLADEHPELVRDVVSVEGNFTLNDAFWSASVAKMTPNEADEMLGRFRSDVPSWLAGAGIQADERTLSRRMERTGMGTHSRRQYNGHSRKRTSHDG